MTGVQTCALPICFPVTIEDPIEPIGKSKPKQKEQLTPKHLHEQIQKDNSGSWGCPQCGYVILNPMIAHNKIICPKCGYDNSKEPDNKVAQALAQDFIALIQRAMTLAGAK